MFKKCIQEFTFVELHNLCHKRPLNSFAYLEASRPGLVPYKRNGVRLSCTHFTILRLANDVSKTESNCVTSKELLLLWSDGKERALFFS